MDVEENTAPTCSYCGSKEVLLDAYVTWDEFSKTWEIHGEPCDKNGFCNDCAGEASITWR